MNTEIFSTAKTIPGRRFASTLFCFASIAILTFCSIAVADDATPIAGETQKILAGDGAANDIFGAQALAVDGSTAVVSALIGDGNVTDSGAVYVFDRSPFGAWVETVKLTASDGAVFDFFGFAVDIDGNTIVVGATGDDPDAVDDGSVYIFTRNGLGVWSEQQRIDASDGVSGATFGRSLALEGSTLIVGTSRDDENGFRAGAVYVFTRDGPGVWSEFQKLTPGDAEIEDNFGFAVSLSGSTLIAGAQIEDQVANNAGAAYIFERNGGGVWSERQKLTASDGADSDFFGWRVAIDGNTAIANANNDDDNGSDSGSVYVFDRNLAGDWIERDKILSSDGAAGDSFGFPLEIQGNTILAGAPGDDDNGSASGSAYIYTRDATGFWTERVKLQPSDGVAGDFFGDDLALDGTTVFVGAANDDDNGTDSGSAYVFNVERFLVPLPSLHALPDINSNGSPDLALIRAGSIIAEIRDGADGTLLRNISFLSNSFTPITAAALPDSDGNGVSELAVLASRNSDGRIVVEMRNVTGAELPRQVWFANNHTPVTMTVIADDADNNGVPELAVLSTRDSDGRGLVEVKNAFEATNPRALWAGVGLTSADVEIVNDADANGVPEIAILSTRDSDGRIVVELKNAAGPTNPNAVWFAPGHTAIDLVSVADKDANGVPEVAVLSSRNSDGRILVEIKNAAGATLPSAVWFAPGHTAHQLAAVNDADGNAVPEVAVLSSRDSDGRILVEVKNAFGVTNPNPIWYSPGFTAQELAILADTDSNSIQETAVLLIRDSDGRILVQGRNAAGSPAPNNYWFSP